MVIELKKLSRTELTKLRAEIDKELIEADERERQQALKAAEQAAAKFGFSLDELSGKGKRRKGKLKRGHSAPKYSNPDNPDQTWTGLGRKPQWFHEAVANGIAPEKMEI